MNTFNVQLVISKDKYPRLFDMLKKERDRKVQEIFDYGYNKLFPKIENNIHNENVDILIPVVSELTSRLDMLMGIGSNSAKKGELAENVLEELINKKYPMYQYISKAKTPHCGDGWLIVNNKTIMMESKNYTSSISKDEVIKMQNDMITNNIRYGIFISWQSKVQTFKDLDFLVFENNKTYYHIFLISNLNEYFPLIDIAIQFMSKFTIQNENNISSYQYCETIKEDISELINIININKNLIDNYWSLSKNINEELFNFEKKLRNYNITIDKIIDNIIHKINNKVIHKINYSNLKIFNIYNKNNKLKENLHKIINIFINNINNINIIEGDEFLLIQKDNIDITTIKINKTKIIININEINININDKTDQKTFLLLEKILSNI
ncbi:hypothetical protein [Chlorella virus XW01]|nr:hypothetical protein [Chlorella virus XW01]